MPNGAFRGKGQLGGGGGGGKGGGKGSGGGAAGGNGDRWNCRICGQTNNFGWRTRCRECEAYRVRGEGGPLSVSRDTTLAERQVQQQRQAQRQEKNHRRATSAAEQRLQAEVERLRNQLLSSGQSNSSGNKPEEDGEGDDGEGDISMDSAEAYTTWTEDERKKKVEDAKASLPYIIGKFGETSKEVAEVRAEISAVEKASRDAKPFKTHRSMLERRRDKLRARIKKDEEEAEQAEAECSELKKKIESLRAGAAERKADLNKVEEELADLVKRALADGDAAGEAGKPEDASPAQWSPQAASATLQALATQPGTPPEFAALLGQLYQAMAAMAAAATTARPGATAGGAVDANPTGQAGGQAAGAVAEAAATAAAAAAATSGATNQATDKQPQPGPSQEQQQHANDPPAGAAGAAARAESEEELLEEADNTAMECDEVEETLRKLPTGDQERLRAAIKSGWRRRRASDGDDGGVGGRREREDRERSPRPTNTKTNSDDA